MKNKLFIIPVLAGLMLSACGTHPANNPKGGDTTLTNYDNKASIDTSKTTSATGNSGTVDNSGAGGTTIAKDSSGIKK